MPLCLIICFMYDNDKMLPSAVKDLENVREFCDKMKIEYITIKDFGDDKNYSNYLTLTEISINIGQQKEKNTIVYYSGHSINGNILLPCGKEYNIIDIYSNITKHRKKNIVWIMDCCGGLNLNLPYMIKNGKFVISPYHKKYYNNQMLAITSCGCNEKTIADTNGSIFTYYLFKILPKIPETYSGNMQTIIDTINYNTSSLSRQTCNIFSNYVIPTVIWTWITSYKNNIIVDDMGSNLSVNGKNIKIDLN